jgi:hypothetical protein
MFLELPFQFLDPQPHCFNSSERMLVDLRLCKGAENRPDCVGKCPQFTYPVVTTLPTSALAIVAWVIAVAFDAMYTAPVASSDDLIAFRPCRCRRRRPALAMTKRTGWGANEGCEHDNANVNTDEIILYANFCSHLHRQGPFKEPSNFTMCSIRTSYNRCSGTRIY